MSSLATIEVFAGAGIDINCTATYSSGDPIDLTGAVPKLEVVYLASRTPPAAGGELLFTCDMLVAGEVDVPAPNGAAHTFRFNVGAAKTVTRGHYRYRVVLEYFDQQAVAAKRIWEGDFVIR